MGITSRARSEAVVDGVLRASQALIDEARANIEFTERILNDMRDHLTRLKAWESGLRGREGLTTGGLDAKETVDESPSGGIPKDDSRPQEKQWGPKRSPISAA